MTASPAHHEYLKSLGAFEAFDYKDPDFVFKVAAVAKSAGAPIAFGFDTITEGSTSKQSADALLASGGEGGKLVMTLPWPGKEQVPKGIELSQTAAFHTGTERSDIGEWLFNEYLPKALENKSVVAAPKVKIVSGGIGAAQKAFDLMKAGVSGKKLVVKVDYT